jgi:hypothetical protein
MTQGYVIFAINTDKVDYHQCARVLTKSLRAVGDIRPVTVITGADLQANAVSSKTHGVYSDDWQVYELSPYNETIKLEADMIVTRPLDSWWTLLKHRDLHIAAGCRNYRQQLSSNRFYRQVNDRNGLPDLYNGITYFKKSKLAQEFFATVREIFKDWKEINQSLDSPSLLPWGDTDTVYAIAAQAIGVELCTMPTDIIQFVHMKQKINNLLVEDWTREMIWELSNTDFRINTVSQLYPVHYHNKELAQHLEPLYDRHLSI